MAVRTEIILVAGGQGRRMGSSTPKAFLKLNGYPVFSHALKTFSEMKSIAGCILVVPVGEEERAGTMCKKMTKLKKVVCGGVRRQDSVRCGMDYLSDQTDIVLIHDAARPFSTPALIDRVIAAAKKTGAAIPGIPLADTLKQVDEKNQVSRTIDRRSMVAVQTPQGFQYSLLKAAYQNAWHKNFAATDDAGLVEFLGGPVEVVEGDIRNFKITRPHDLKLAEILLRSRSI